jgi:signal transduction histidine kinase
VEAIGSFQSSPAIEALAEAANGFFQGTILGDLENTDGLIPRDVEIALYRIAQESLDHVVKHSKATAASITLRVARGAILMTVKDDGCGISSKTGSRGFGLLGMQERATLLEGTLSVVPDALGGTIVTLIIPLRMK